MNTLTKGIAKRAISILLVAIMVLSLGIIGISTASAAEFETAETGEFSDSVYILNNIDGWDNYKEASADSGRNKFTRTLVNCSTSADLYFRVHIGGGQNTCLEATANDRSVYSNYCNSSASNFYNKDIIITDGYYKPVGSGNQGNVWKIDLTQLKSTYSKVTVDINMFSEYYVGTTRYTNVVSIKIYNGVSVSKDYYLPGTFNGWKTSETKLEADGSNYSATLSLATGNYEFKLYDSTSDWYGTSSSAQIAPQPDPDKSVSVTMDTDADGNAKVNITTAGDYKFSFNPSTMKITVTFVKAAFDFELNATADLTTVTQGTHIVIIATSNGEDKGATVTYTLKNGSTVIDSNNDGVFDVDTSKLSGDYNYTVEAACTISGVNYSGSASVSFKVNAFTGLTVKLVSYPKSVECNSPITVKVSANTSEKVTYVITDEATGETYESPDGNFSIATTVADKNTTKSFVLSATAEVNGKTYESNKLNFSVNITDITNTTEISIYFKSTTTYGYAPVASTRAVFESLENVHMEKHTFIRNNATDTADYWWFVVTTEVSKANPTVEFSVVSSRYDMEASCKFDVVEGVTEYYFGVDNLNNGIEMVNLTSEEDINIRDFCESAVHMVYDPEFDAEETLAAVASTFARVQNGDVNGDGKVNVRDATLLQKSLANIEELSDVGTKVADANNDGTITIKDATAIQKQIAGL